MIDVIWIKPMKKIKYIVLAVIIIIGVWIVNFYFSFSFGSFHGFLAEQRSLPDEGTLEALRSEAIQELTQAHAEFSSFTDLALYETSYSDLCSKGTHSWKREDPFAYVCSYRLTYYYGSKRDYIDLLRDLEKTLGDLGWEFRSQNPEQATISEAIGDYSGEVYLVELPVYKKKVPGGSMYLTINGFDGYGVHWTTSNNEPSPHGFGTARYQDIYMDGSNISPEEIFNEIISGGQDAVMMAIHTAYFAN